VWRLLKKLKIELPCDPAISLLGIYPKEFKSGYNKGTCTPIFIAVLFTIVKLWKQPRYSTTDEQIKKMWCLYTMEFYSATKKNEILSFAGKCMELENICKIWVQESGTGPVGGGMGGRGCYQSEGGGVGKGSRRVEG
jgi:hypothetical protein